MDDKTWAIGMTLLVLFIMVILGAAIFVLEYSALVKVNSVNYVTMSMATAIAIIIVADILKMGEWLLKKANEAIE
jgi:hypothetical protein